VRDSAGERLLAEFLQSIGSHVALVAVGVIALVGHHGLVLSVGGQNLLR
jgi:hypothetical protein